MVKTLETLSLAELLRYFFCGGVFVYAYRYSRGAHGLPATDSSAALFFVALLAGSIIYAVHRSLLYPTLSRAALWLALGLRPRSRIGARHFNPFKPLEGEAIRDEARWKRRQDKKGIQPHLDEWASQVHLLYCVAWATALGSVVANSFEVDSGAGKAQFSLFLFLVIAVSLVAAFSADYRRRWFEERESRATGKQEI